tara:strand:+ start:36 stop:317 length:282 start_codon:yes stop_codon:yes gene_type:complete
MILTKHCSQRMQQRGIPQELPFLIKEYGEFINSHNDRKYFCNKKTIKKLTNDQSGRVILKKYDKHLLNTAIVCNEEICITVMKIKERKMMRRN